MAGLPLPPPNRPQLSTGDQISSSNSAKFAQIPSWVSLKRSSSAVKTEKTQQGKLENLHLVSLSNQGKLKEAHDFLKEMDDAGVSVTLHSYQCLFETCGKLLSLADARSIHDRLRRTSKNPSGSLENSLLRMYCDCGSFTDAQKVFDEMLLKNLVSWVIIISAYAQNGELSKAIKLFSDMQATGIRPNSAVYISLLQSCLDPPFLELGKQIHSHLIRSQLNSNTTVETAICNMYVKCGWLEGAKLVFDGMNDQNAVAWTGLMVGYTQAKKPEIVLKLFARMVMEGVELDEFVFSIVLKACCELEDWDMGRQIHSLIVKLGLESDVPVGTPLVDFYAKCGNINSACQSFGRISEPNDVSWSALISGFSQSGRLEDCIKIFASLKSKGMDLNSFTYTSVFQACAALADFNMGSQAHGDAIKRGLVSYLYGESAMVTMYSKCGRLDYARRAFESIDEPDVVAWTAIISGYAYHGNAAEALGLFRRMQSYGVRPNAVTFIAVLTSCSHSGLVAEAKQYLDSMSRYYGVDPTIDHYDCMIDAYSRAGLLQDALELITSMPLKPDAMSWKSLLGGCWAHRDLKLGKIAGENLFRLNPDDTAGYILLFNLYSAFGEWEEAARVRKLMAEQDLKKEISCSWISVKGKVNRFVVGDRHHQQTEAIYSKLKEFEECSVLDSQSRILSEEDEFSGILPERKEQLLDHSEKLAIAFGLISTDENTPIMVFKNLRACTDCHEFGKKVSMVTGRRIVVRDSTRFHHFESGKCSCNDYW